MAKTAKRSIILSAVLAIVMCASLIAGATFAIFTSESKVNIAVTSGKVKVEATITDFEVYSPTLISMESGNSIVDGSDAAVQSEGAVTGTFYNGGTATLDGGTVTLDKMTPGDKVTFKITVTNYSNVKAKYRTKIKVENDNGLFAGLNVNIGGITIQSSTAWKDLPAAGESGTEVASYDCSVELPASAGNEYQDKKCDITYIVEAVQGNVLAVADVVSAEATGNLTVNQDEGAKAVVNAAQTISDNTMSVTYPEGTVLLSTTGVSTSDDGTQKATAEQKLEYMGSTASSVTISIDDNQAVAQYELTLPVDKDDNGKLVTVTINYTSGLSGVTIYHSGEELASTAVADGEEAKEYAEYDANTGVITLHLFHASPIDIVYDKPGIATVTTQAELNAAIANTGIKTIKLGADWNGNMLVNGANGITLDFNGYTVSGTMFIGATRDNIIYGRADASTLTLMDSKGTGGVKTTQNQAIWMMSSSDLTIESGTYESTGISNHNRTVYVADSKLTVNGGYFHNNATKNNFHWVIQCDNKLGPAVLVINDGKFEGPSSNCGQDYLIKASEADTGYESGSVTINGGEFYTYTSNSYLAQGYSDVTVNNCTFVYESTNKTWTNKVFSLENGYTLTVKGGTFTVNGNAYTNPDWSK